MNQFPRNLLDERHSCRLLLTGGVGPEPKVHAPGLARIKLHCGVGAHGRQRHSPGEVGLRGCRFRNRSLQAVGIENAVAVDSHDLGTALEIVPVRLIELEIQQCVISTIRRGEVAHNRRPVLGHVGLVAVEAVRVPSGGEDLRNGLRRLRKILHADRVADDCFRHCNHEQLLDSARVVDRDARTVAAGFVNRRRLVGDRRVVGRPDAGTDHRKTQNHQKG